VSPCLRLPPVVLCLLAAVSLALSAPPVISPRRVVLPATEFTLRLGMKFSAVETALRPLELDERGTDHERVIYTTGVDVGSSDYTVDLTFAADSLVSIAISSIDSGLVDQWFHARVDSLPLTASYERAPGEDDLVRETWTTFDAVWATEHPAHPERGIDMTYWEFRLR
jgi:hypothetical protein